MSNIDEKLYKNGRKQLEYLRNKFEGENLNELNNIIEATTLVTFKEKRKILKLLKKFSDKLEDDKKNMISSVFFYFDDD